MKQFFYFLFLYILGITEAFTQNVSSENQYSKLEIINNGNLIKYDKDYFFGIKITLEDGWKTYWKNPGDSGAAIYLEWNSLKYDNISSKIIFPVPKKYIDMGIETIGYEKEVIFPIKITFDNLERNPLTNLKINYLVCKEICIPIEVEKQINLDKNKAVDGLLNIDFIESLEKLPNKKNTIFKLDKIKRYSPSELEISYKVKQEINYDKLQIFPYSEKLFLKTNHSILNNYLVIQILSDDEIKKFDTLELLISDGKSSQVSKLEVIDDTLPENFLKMVLFAFIGGLILNFMPCVLPVLSIKIYSFLKVFNTNKRDIIYSSLATSIGIICSFLLIGLTTIFIKSLGSNVGWGIQFQNVYFLYFFSIILFIFSLNLFGFFDFFLPNKLLSKLNFPTKNYYVDSFFAGLLATLLATPCTAPFLGTSIGFALTKDNFTILLIFLSLSIGFSFPYILLMIYPKALNFFPKPGAWMQQFKYLLALFVLMTSIWLFYLLKFNIFFLIILGFVVPIFAVFYNIEIKHPKKIKNIFFLFVVFIVFYIFSEKELSKTEWIKFDQYKVNEMISEGNIVFVDITAAWCITCQTNKLTTLSTNEIENLFIEKEIKTFRGDWTMKDTSILNYLNQFQRSGIPFNVIYGPSNTRGLVLPEILTKDTVINSIKLVQ